MEFNVKRALSVTALIPIVNDQLTYKAEVFAKALVALKYLNVVGGTTIFGANSSYPRCHSNT